MKYLKLRLVLAALILFPVSQLFSQTDVYSVTSGELLYQWADLSFTDAYQAANPDDQLAANPLRFTCFFHIGQFVHIDFNNNFGIYTGGAIRNVGFISDEKLDVSTNGTPDMEDYKIIRRTYSLGVPLAIKIGSFKDNTYIFAGGEYELNFAYKEKYWNSQSRDGAKTKNTEWFGDQTPLFIPSVFAGVQFPGGINVKFKYYLDNFINNKHTNKDQVFDLTRYEQTQVMYVSLCWQFNTKAAASKMTKEDKFSRL